MKGLKTGGRQKGTPNKQTQDLHELAKKLEFNPIETMMLFAKGDWKALGYEAECYFKETANEEIKLGYVISPEMRLNAAKEVSQYLYPKRKEQIEAPPTPKFESLNPEDKKQFLLKAKEEIKKLEDELSDSE